MPEWLEVKTDVALPENVFRWEHPDGRIDCFMWIEGEMVPIKLTTLDNSPCWACPVCAFINEQVAAKCECCGITDRITNTNA